MDKYTGCNIVDSVVSAPPKPTKTVKRRSIIGFAVRVVIAAAAVGFFCLLKYTDVMPSFVGDVARKVFCYDVFGRDGFGSMPMISQIFGAK